MTKGTILVTGGAGYIGSHTCKLLHAKGYVPIVLDNLVYGHRSFVKWGPFYEGDIGDNLLLDTIFQQHSPEAVIHFAAYAYVGESVAKPLKYYQNNVAGTLGLLYGMHRNRCDKIVFSSSCATYGLPESLPINEEQKQVPINPYGRSKLMVEQILADSDQAYGIKSVSLRYFNAAGADAEGELGEDHAPETHLIPLALYSILGRIDRLEVYGSDYPTPDGTAMRDYIHVHDLAAAHVRSIEYLAAENTSQCINLGTGRGLSVQEIIDLAEKVTGQGVPVLHADRRLGDPPLLVADAAKARNILGWRPVASDPENIIGSAWNWHRSRHAKPSAKAI